MRACGPKERQKLGPRAVVAPRNYMAARRCCFSSAARRLLWVLCRCVFIVINNVYCIPTYVVWMAVLRPLKKWRADLYWRAEGLFFHWLLGMVALWCDSAGYKSKSIRRGVSSLRLAFKTTNVVDVGNWV